MNETLTPALSRRTGEGETEAGCSEWAAWRWLRDLDGPKSKSPKPKVRSGRWIMIARVKAGMLVVTADGNQSYFGIKIWWQGRIGVFQPLTARNWPELLGTIDRRMDLDGLEVMSVAVARTREQWPWDTAVYVKVRRSTGNSVPSGT